MSKQIVAEVIALIELGMIAPEDIVKCLRKANSEPETAQPEERNFCPRCGKRTRDLTHIHTCTPPQEKRHDD